MLHYEKTEFSEGNATLHTFTKGKIKIELSYDTTIATDNNGTEIGEEVKGLHVFVLYKTDEDKWQPICKDIWNESVIEQQMKMNDLLAEVELQNLHSNNEQPSITERPSELSS
tara:strand:+ start:1045 stop:1383 length:339 start_codon:yes stop_codon:yes gene_type:complete